VKKKRKVYLRPKFSVYHEVTVIDKVTGELKVLMVSKDKKYLEAVHKNLGAFFSSIDSGDRFSVILLKA
jgi:hypothetical protein